MILGRFGRLAARNVALHVAITALAGAALFLIVDFVELGNLAADTASSGELGKLSLFNLPRVFQTLLPVAAPIGVLTGIGALVRRREIEALISAGATPLRLLAPVFVVGLSGALLYAANAEWIVPRTAPEVSAIRRKLGLSAGPLDRAGGRQTWFRGKDRLVRVSALADSKGAALEGVTLLRVEGGELIERWDMERLEYLEDRWLGSDVVLRRFDRQGESLATERFEQRPIELAEKPADFVLEIAAPDRLRFAELLETAGARERLGHAAHLHRLEIARRITGPATVMLAMALAAAIALRLGRRQSVAKALGAGAAIGATIWLASEMASLFGGKGAASPAIAASLVPFSLVLAAIWAWLAARSRGVSEG